MENTYELEYDGTTTLKDVLDDIEYYREYGLECIVKINGREIDANDINFKEKVSAALKNLNAEEYETYKKESKMIDILEDRRKFYTDMYLSTRKDLIMYLNIALTNIKEEDRSKLLEEAAIDYKRSRSDSAYLFKYIALLLNALNDDNIKNIYKNLLNVMNEYRSDLKLYKRLNYIFDIASMYATKYSSNGHILNNLLDTNKYEDKASETMQDIQKIENEMDKTLKR